MKKQNILTLTPKSSFYNTKTEITMANENFHNEIFISDRELYTGILYFNNATYYTKGLIIKNLLKNSIYKKENSKILEVDPQRRLLEDKLICYALMNQNITHSLKTLLSLKHQRINNERTTNIILDFIFNRNNTDFICIKYKNKIKQLLIHSLGLNKINNILNSTEKGVKYFNKYISKYKNRYDKEVLNFVFNKDYDFTSKYIIEYNLVSNSFKNKEENKIKNTIVPIEVLEGFSAFYNRRVNIASLVAKGNLSDKQKIQKQNVVKKHSNDVIEIKIDLTKYSMLELFKYMYNKKDISTKEKKEIKDIFEIKAAVIGNKLSFENRDTCIIVDNSLSHCGSIESINHPFYMNKIISTILEKYYISKGSFVRIITVGGDLNDNNLFIPSGDTCLYEPLIKGLEDGFKNFIFISDGFNNIGDFEEIYSAINRICDINSIHFNPVFSPKDMSCKQLSSLITTIPFKGEEDLEFLELSYLLDEKPEDFKKFIRNKFLMQGEV